MSVLISQVDQDRRRISTMLKSSISDDRFIELLLIAQEDEKLPFLETIYKLVDQLAAEELHDSNVHLACHEGCSVCCHQLIAVLPIEWPPIERYIVGEMSNYVRKLLMQRAKRMVPAWKEWKRFDNNRSATEPNRAYKHWLEKPCPFLAENGSCSIYPVRPIVCRAASSTNRCQTVKEPGGMAFTFSWQLLANNLIMDEQKRVLGIDHNSVTPLIQHLEDFIAERK
jgi:Fe-S-cluster containining protein